MERVPLKQTDRHHKSPGGDLCIRDREYQGKGLATRAAKLAMDYGFTVLNLYKLYLIVDKENEKAIHIYRKLGFTVEGELMHEFFINGQYRNAIRMCIFQHQYLAEHKTPGQTLLKPTAQ